MLDATDIKLIEELQEDARQSNRILARKVGVSEGTIRRRIKELRSRDLVGITAVPNYRNLGFEFICIMGLEVELDELEEAGKKLANCPNVYYLSTVTGHYDLIAILLFHKANDLNDFVRETISTMPGVLRTETFVSMNIVKSPWQQAPGVSDLPKSKSPV